MQMNKDSRHKLLAIAYFKCDSHVPKVSNIQTGPGGGEEVSGMRFWLFWPWAGADIIDCVTALAGKTQMTWVSPAFLCDCNTCSVVSLRNFHSRMSTQHYQKWTKNEKCYKKLKNAGAHLFLNMITLQIETSKTWSQQQGQWCTENYSGNVIRHTLVQSVISCSTLFL